MTKEECVKASEIISQYMFTKNIYTPTINEAVDAIELIVKLITEHFDNPPLRFEDLKEDMWVWDNKEKMYCQIISILSFNKISVNYHYESLLKFEENRFYIRKTTE